MNIDINRLTLRQKIGQMICCGFEGTEPSPEIVELIEQHHLGGVIYFSRNIANPKQVFELSQALQKRADIPLLISIDQEGGMVARITEGVTLMPGNMALGATRDVEGVYESAKVSGTELRVLGINVNYAPCLDVNNNPKNPVIGVRSYGENPELVAQMGAAAVKGYQDAGVSATIKHFPGHGDTQVDSHLDLPVIPHEMSRLQAVELVPFQRAINEGVDSIMTAHVVFTALDQETDETGKPLPSTLSKSIITGLLREKMGYDGVIVTDCMEMKAISDHFGTERAAVLAVEAGVDQVLISHRMDRQVGAIEALVQAVESGRISEERINQSVERILRLKATRHIDQSVSDWFEARQILSTEASRSLARSLSERSMTLVKDENKAIPLQKAEATYVVIPRIGVTAEVDEQLEQKATLGLRLARYLGGDVTEKIVETNPTEQEIEQILIETEHVGQIIVATYNAMFHPKQVELVKRLMERGSQNGLKHTATSPRLIVVALRNPFDFHQFPEVPTFLATYESRPLALDTVAKLLAGQLQALGQLPVTLSDEFSYGWSLS
ncbi:beta-N-acetylhexosaminidase [Brevibacillus dissolubilis]|uniref:beta-N-acetylhexosaminidase n=1 Tax=Brevibacillus dissolubilis TaxID=1844116 RepID=UPI001116DA8B|nr:beta-N-acetylhexosaminidase [Brevibacillus dissolubilis]